MMFKPATVAEAKMNGSFIDILISHQDHFTGLSLLLLEVNN